MYTILSLVYIFLLKFFLYIFINNNNNDNDKHKIFYNKFIYYLIEKQNKKYFPNINKLISTLLKYLKYLNILILLIYI